MDLRKYRWSRDYESAEEELQNLLVAKNIAADRWAAVAGQVFATHMHALDKRLWCAEGSINVTVNGKPISLQPGDTLDLPAYTPHEAVAGISGCVCYESPRQVLNPPL